MNGKELLFIAISVFSVTLIWIASNVYHAYATSTIDSLLQVHIAPIAPTFDQATIGKLKQRTTVEPLNSDAIEPILTPTVTPEEEQLELLPEEILDETSASSAATP